MPKKIITRLVSGLGNYVSAKIHKYMYWSHIFDNIQDLVCQECHSQLHMFTSECDEVILGDNLAESRAVWNFVNFETLMFVCKKCASTHVCCAKCSGLFGIDNDRRYVAEFSPFALTPVKDFENRGKIFLQKFLGYGGESIMISYNRSNVTNKKILVETPFIRNLPISDEEIVKGESSVELDQIIPFYVGDKNLHCFNSISLKTITGWSPQTLYLTGPCGGEYHHWKCENCNAMSAYTDK